MRTSGHINTSRARRTSSLRGWRIGPGRRGHASVGVGEQGADGENSNRCHEANIGHGDLLLSELHPFSAHVRMSASHSREHASRTATSTSCTETAGPRTVRCEIREQHEDTHVATALQGAPRPCRVLRGTMHPSRGPAPPALGPCSRCGRSQPQPPCPPPTAPPQLRPFRVAWQRLTVRLIWRDTSRRLPHKVRTCVLLESPCSDPQMLRQSTQKRTHFYFYF
jgi:hypothetical protein